MTDPLTDWLRAQQERLAQDLRGHLDVESGLRDIYARDDGRWAVGPPATVRVAHRVAHAEGYRVLVVCGQRFRAVALLSCAPTEIPRCPACVSAPLRPQEPLGHNVIVDDGDACSRPCNKNVHGTHSDHGPFHV